MVEQSDLAQLPPLQTDEFLPPISRWTTAGAWMVVGVLMSITGLAATVEYNVTVQAGATVRPESEVSTVQAGSGGTIRRIVVQENQTLEQGDVIAELGIPDRDRLSNLQTRYKRIQRYIQQYQTQLERVDSQLNQLNQEQNPQASTQASNQRDRFQQQRLSLTNQIRYDQMTLQTISSELNKLAIVTPIDGTILKLSLRNGGQTVQPGEVIAQIVPNNVPLIVKARVDVQDISQVAVGQPAQLRISAYPYPDYGILQGVVKSLSPDVIAPRDNPSQAGMPYYEVTIQPDRSYLKKGTTEYPLQPGMEARADIISRQETVLQAFLRKLRLWVDP